MLLSVFLVTFASNKNISLSAWRAVGCGRELIRKNNRMKSGEFFRKVFSWRLWLNLVAMVLVVVLLCLGVKYGIDLYTHHGEKIEVPNIKHKSFKDAKHILDDRDLEIVVSDTGYVKTLPPDCILEQQPEAGAIVKSGRIIYVIINSPSTPKLTIPDIIDNSSVREARAKLMAMGFKVLEPEYVPGEKDWVYGIKVRGRSVVTGDRVSIEEPLILLVGDGHRDLMGSVSYVDPVFEPEDEEDDFEEITGPVEHEEHLAVPSEHEEPQPAEQVPAERPQTTITTENGTGTN